jgi:hypothetical protein
MKNEQVRDGPASPCLTGAFDRPPHERQRIVAGVCDRLVGNLDRSLRVAREFCASLEESSRQGVDGRGDRARRGPSR